MSGNISNDPKWLLELERELGLDDTPATVEEEVGPALIDVIKRTEFTTQGWARVRDIIVKAGEDANIDIFHRILKGNPDEAMMFTAMVGLPYYLGKSLRYSEEHLEKMTTFVAASYVIAMNRGYRLGQEDIAEWSE